MSSGTTLTCATCGNEEPEGSRFCGSCGAPYVTMEASPADTPTSSGTTLTCSTCGHDEPEGSQFCGNCGAPFVPLAPETPIPRPAAEERSPVAPAPAPGPTGNGRLRWIAAGAAVGLLVAGGAVAGVLALTRGNDATEATPTEQESLPAATTDSLPPASSPTLAVSIAPFLEELAASQSALSAQVRSLEAGAESLADLQFAADALAAGVVRTQEFLDSLAPNDSTEAGTLSLLRRALASHLAYAQTIASLPARPRSFTQTEAQSAIARAEEARSAYVELTVADPSLPIVSISSSEHTSLIAAASTPPPTRRVVDLVPLLVGIRPDDPLGEGRCFGPYGRASLRVSGGVYRSGFIQCGDDAKGDPSRATGVYRFSGLGLPAGSSLVRITARPVIDEFSSPSQRGSSVSWTVFYDSAQICSAVVTWSGSRPSPGNLDCRFPAGVATSGGFDIGLLRIQQNASLASSGALWAGLLYPTIFVEVTG